MRQLFRVSVYWIPVAVGGCFVGSFLLDGSWIHGASATLITLGWVGLALKFTTKNLKFFPRIIITILLAIILALVGAGAGWLVVFLAKWIIFGVAYVVLWAFSIIIEALKIFHISPDISITDIPETISKMNICVHEDTVYPEVPQSRFKFDYHDSPYKVCQTKIGNYLSAGTIILFSGMGALFGVYATWISAVSSNRN